MLSHLGRSSAVLMLLLIPVLKMLTDCSVSLASCRHVLIVLKNVSLELYKVFFFEKKSRKRLTESRKRMTLVCGGFLLIWVLGVFRSVQQLSAYILPL